MIRKALGVITSVCIGAGVLFAGPVAAEETSDWEFSGNVALTNNYVWRGYTQSDGDFAVQGGFDVAHSSGFYAGVWASNVDFGDGATNVELDLYGGFAGDFGNSMFSYDVGFVYYAYPGGAIGDNAEFVEFGGTLGADLGGVSLSAGIWWSPDFFGASGDAIYVPIGIEVPISVGNGPLDLTASANVGFNKYLDLNSSYINWDIGVTVAVQDWFDVDLRYYDTDEPEVDCKNVCDARFVAAISRSF